MIFTGPLVRLSNYRVNTKVGSRNLDVRGDVERKGNRSLKRSFASSASTIPSSTRKPAKAFPKPRYFQAKAMTRSRK